MRNPFTPLAAALVAQTLRFVCTCPALVFVCFVGGFRCFQERVFCIVFLVCRFMGGFGTFLQGTNPHPDLWSASSSLLLGIPLGFIRFSSIVQAIREKGE